MLGTAQDNCGKCMHYQESPGGGVCVIVSVMFVVCCASEEVDIKTTRQLQHCVGVVPSVALKGYE